MMKAKTIIFSGMAVLFLGGCVPGILLPVPSYSVDSYIGSLDKCLNIEGTYEARSYYRNYSGEDPQISGTFGPGLSYVTERKSDQKMSTWESKNGKIVYKKTWVTFQTIDNQRLEKTLFNEEGQARIDTIDMRKGPPPPRVGSGYADEEFVCDQTSWQWVYNDVSYGETSSKWRKYSKTTKLPDGTLRTEIKSDWWTASLAGLSTRKASSEEGVGYFRKVDLTVDDIRAMNDKAKRAIEQYDQIATSPPPERK
ncbi:MAG: hypothetical protein LBB65_04135 [Burkholderiales bacterium]|jgi:hypothetical protein|nr:hypothetical protein [Burkholderiales bacterium]